MTTPTPRIDRRTLRYGPPAPWAGVEGWLAAHTGRRWYYQADDTHQDDLTDGIAADLLGCTAKSIARWRQAGTIPLRSLEDAAGHLGVHPSELWADYVATIIELDGAAT